MRDEHDPDSGEIEFVSTHEWNVDASIRPDELDDAINFDIPEHEDYETLAGLVTLELGRLANVGDTVYVSESGELSQEQFGPDESGSKPRYIRLMVTEMDGVRIERLLVSLHGESKDSKDYARHGKGGSR